MMKESYENEIRELRLDNIRLDSENKAVGMRASLFENMVKDYESSEAKRASPNDSAAFRIIT